MQIATTIIKITSFPIRLAFAFPSLRRGKRVFFIFCLFRDEVFSLNIFICISFLGFRRTYQFFESNYVTILCLLQYQSVNKSWLKMRDAQCVHCFLCLILARWTAGHTTPSKIEQGAQQSDVCSPKLTLSWLQIIYLHRHEPTTGNTQ